MDKTVNIKGTKLEQVQKKALNAYREQNEMLWILVNRLTGVELGSDDPLKSAVNPEKPKKKSRANDIGLKLIDGGKKLEDQPPFTN